jgi:hypothetical protein
MVRLHDEMTTPVDMVTSLQEALHMYIEPQLRTLSASFSLDARALLPKQQGIDLAEVTSEDS